MTDTPGPYIVEKRSDPSALAPYEHVTPAQICAQYMELMRFVCQSIDKALVGRLVRVTSDHNGQPYGRSRKSWKGQVCRIKAVSIDPMQGEMHLCLEGHEYGECFIRANEVEFT